MGKTLGAQLAEIVDSYYKATEMEVRAHFFFTIVDVYNKLKANGYSSKMMTVMQNIIVMG